MLAAKSEADEKGSAKKNRHQHIWGASLGVEAFPLGEPCEAENDEADGIKKGGQHGGSYGQDLPGCKD